MIDHLELPRPSNEGPAVPLLVDGMLDEAVFNNYIADLRAHAHITSILEKHAPHAFSLTEQLALDTVAARLRSGQTRAAQLRYHFDGAEWADTIIALAGKFRVVRCRLAHTEPS